MKKTLLVIVMPIGRKNVNVDLCLEDFVDQAMLLCDGTTPLTTTIPLQLLRVTRASFGMLFQFLYKLISFSISSGLRTFQFLKVFDSLWRIDNLIHQPTLCRNSSNDSSGNISTPSPRLICSLASSTRAKNSSLVRRVGSVSFSETSLRKYLAARFSRFSSSAIMLILRSNSA